EYLREHMPEHARLHYVITKGGKAPNVVPTEASVWYYVRAPDRVQVERLTDRVDKVAEGAATMTGTELDRRFITGCWQFLPNRTITDLMWTNLQDLGPIDFTAEDREFAAALRETLDPDAIEDRLSRLEPDVREMIREHSLAAEPIGPAEEAGLMLGSTEVSDVSWLTPTGEFLGACWPVGTTAHTWQAVAASGDFGRKTAVYIAKALAGTAYDLFAEPDGVAAAQDEFESAKAGREYETPLPAEAEPPFDVGIE
ncbi:MAG: amidohydrolase, partial [Halobacteriales archaeon]